MTADRRSGKDDERPAAPAPDPKSPADPTLDSSQAPSGSTDGRPESDPRQQKGVEQRRSSVSSSNGRAAEAKRVATRSQVEPIDPVAEGEKREAATKEESEKSAADQAGAGEPAPAGAAPEQPEGAQVRMIIIRNLLFRRGQRVILRDLNLDVNHGALLAVMGMSGCGKSTLLKLIAGLEKPDQGQIIIGGQNIAGMRERELDRVRQTMGFVFQGAALFDYMTVYENVAFPLHRHTALPEKEIKQRVSERLALVGLEGTEECLPGELSGGMQKRVGLARAIAADPPPQILLYDEPTAGLDPIMTAVINDLILRVRDELEVTSVVVTHDMGSLKLADQVAMIHNGIIEAIGTPEELIATTNPVVDQFIHGRAEGPIDVGNTSVELS